MSVSVSVGTQMGQNYRNVPGQKVCSVDSPGQVLDVHQHGVLLHMQLVSQQQQLHQLLVQTYVSNISSSFSFSEWCF